MIDTVVIVLLLLIIFIQNCSKESGEIAGRKEIMDMYYKYGYNYNELEFYYRRPCEQSNTDYARGVNYALDELRRRESIE